MVEAVHHIIGDTAMSKVILQLLKCAAVDQARGLQEFIICVLLHIDKVSSSVKCRWL